MAPVAVPNATPAQKQQFFEEVLPRIARLPGAIGAATTTGFPPYGGMTTDVDVPGKAHLERWTVMFERCSDSYFRTLGFHFLRGVPLSRNDVVHARQVAVVNQTLVRKYFANEDPIGKRIRLDRLAVAPDSIADPSFEIVGVVADIRNQGVEEASLPEAFIPFTIGSIGFPGILVRIANDPGTMLNSIRREIRATNKNVLQRNPMTVDQILRDFAFATPRFSMLLLSVFAGIGLVLVGSGVYGVMAYSVSRQTREIGIRMALGAEPGHVFRAVLRMTIGLIGLGVCAGALLSFVTNRVISSKVWTVAVFDPIALASGIAVIVVLGLIACSVPALRATRINPMTALRSE
jgi:putative ABC transport system permease protein